MNRIVLICLCHLAATLGLLGQKNPEIPASKMVPPKFAEGLVIGRNQYTYVDNSDKRRLTLDTYRPDKADGPLPILVMYFGGGWMNGRPGHFTPLAQAIAHKGYVTVVPNYRLSGEAPFPAAVHDCKAAVRWARKNAKMLKGDPNKIAVTGGSAGGHLAGFVAATNGNTEFEGVGDHLNQSSVVQAAIVMCGSMDFNSDRIQETIATNLEKGQTNAIVNFLNATPTENPGIYKKASPNTHLCETMPPTLFIDGEFDNPKIRYTKTWEMMDALNIPHEFIMMKKAPHPFWNYDVWFEDTVDAIDEFLKKYLK